jgi:hypothetical protein
MYGEELREDHYIRQATLFPHYLFTLSSPPGYVIKTWICKVLRLLSLYLAGHTGYEAVLEQLP